MTTSGRKALIVMLLLVGVPMIAGLLTFRWSNRGQTSNYGMIVEPSPLPAETLTDVGGSSFEFEALRGRWILVLADPGACDELCRKRLFLVRQIRTALGKDMGRIERVWMVSDGATPESALLADHAGTRVVRAAGSRALALLNANGSESASFFLVDPLGNVMLRYPKDPDARRVLKDLEHLLRLSRVG